MDLKQHVWDFIVTHGLLHTGDTLVLGVSGGPDSLVLLDLFALWAPEHRLVLHVAHLNHGLRPEAPAEADFVRAEAEVRGLPFHLEAVDTAVFAAQRRLSVEEAARALRYDFLARVAGRVGAGRVAVAHTRDDQAETVLMHFLRGSGLAGLRGMLPLTDLSLYAHPSSGPAPASDTSSPSLQPPASSLPPPSVLGPPSSSSFTRSVHPSSLVLIRPLLSSTRADILAYCQARGLQPRIDASNLDLRYLRNRLRHEMLPLLEAYNPNLRSVLAATGDVAAGEYELLQQAVQAAWDEVVVPSAGGEERVVFDRQRWLALGVPAQRALLRAAVQRLRRNLRDVDFAPVEAAVRFSRRAGPGRSYDLVAGLCLSTGLGWLSVHSWGSSALPAPAGQPLLDEAGCLADGWRLVVGRLAEGEWSWEQVRSAAPRGLCVYVDAERVGGAELAVRRRRPGDRFQPLGLGGHSRKVSDFMINARVDAPQRGRWPLVVAGDEIVWLAGLRLDHRFRVTPETKSVARLSFAQLASP